MAVADWDLDIGSPDWTFMSELNEVREYLRMEESCSPVDVCQRAVQFIALTDMMAKESEEHWEAVCTALNIDKNAGIVAVLERIELIKRAAAVLMPSRMERTASMEKILGAMRLLSEVVNEFGTDKILDHPGSS